MIQSKRSWVKEESAVKNGQQKHGKAYTGTHQLPSGRFCFTFTDELILTDAQRFIAKAAELMPHQDELQDIDPSIDSHSEIDEIMFRKGEYLGGMAAVILSLLASE